MPKRKRETTAKTGQGCIPNRPVFLYNQDGGALVIADDECVRAIPHLPNGNRLLVTSHSVSIMSPEGIVTVKLVGDPEGAASTHRFDTLGGVAPSPDGTRLYLADKRGHTIKQVDLKTREVTIVAGGKKDKKGKGDGVGANAQFKYPVSLATNSNGTELYVADAFGESIRRLNLKTFEVTTVAGGTQGRDDGVGEDAQFNSPRGIVMSPDNTKLYLVDSSNNSIRQLDLKTFKVTTVAGGKKGKEDGVGANARFNYPHDLAISPDGTKLYVADTHNNRIRRLDLKTGVVTTIGYPVRAHALGISPSGDTLLAVDWRHSQITLVHVPLPDLVVPPSTFDGDIRDMQEDKSLPKGSVTFIVGPQEHRIENVHIALLRARSEYFSGMFRSGMKEGENREVIVPDATADAFEALLVYIATDTVTAQIDAHTLWDLLRLADKYCLTRLQSICQNAIATRLSPQNAMGFLRKACEKPDDWLVQECRKFIVNHGEEITQSAECQELDEVFRMVLSDAYNLPNQPDASGSETDE